MKVLLIIPAYNEEDSILKVYEKIKKQKNKYDVIVINDGSTDKTGKICDKNDIPCIHLVHNLGIGGAVQTGYKYAYEHQYEVAVQFDGDKKHDISYVEDLILPIEKKEANMVIGSRFIAKEKSSFQSTKARRIGIRVISFFIRLVTGKTVLDTTSGFRAVDQSLIERFAKQYPAEYPEPVSTTEILKEKYKIKEIPVNMHEREGGISSIRAWKNIYYMLNVILSILVTGIGGKKK